MNHENLKKALTILSSKKVPKEVSRAFKLIIWELVKAQTQVKKLMDKQINKVKKSVQKGSKEQALHQIGSLLKMDKKADAKMATKKKA